MQRAQRQLGTSLRAVGLAILLSLCCSSWAGSHAETEAPLQVTRVTAQRFKFVPSRIKVPAGTRLRIELESRDVEHGFEVVSADTELVIPARGQGGVAVELAPMAPGRYRFRCSRNCGAGHAGMRGVIVVE